MRAWQVFWTAALLVAGVCFAGITVVVAIRGFHDLRALFRQLSTRKDEPE